MKNKLLFTAGALFLAVTGFFGYSALSTPANAADCGASAVIKCGVTSITDLRNKYNADATKGAQNIYSYFGLSSQVVNKGIYKQGYVTKSGNVVVDGKVVATNAISAGRLDAPGSTKQVVGGTTFYTRPTSIALRTDNMAAIVFFDDKGRFIGGVINDCGNPIKGVNKVVVQPPVYKCDALRTTKVSRDTYDYAVSYTAQNGATFKNFSINFGDGQTKTGLTSSVRHTYAKPGTYKAVATVNFMVDGVAKSVNCETTVTVAVAPNPGVKIAKTVNNVEHKTVAIDQPFSYELVATNTGNVDLVNVKVTDAAPAGVGFTKADVGTVANNNYTYTIPSLKAGASTKMVITAKLTKYVAGTITNKACIDATEVSGNPDSCDTATIDTPKMIKVCDTTTDAIVTINEKDFVTPRYTKDLTQCDKVTVCDTKTGKIVTLPKNDETDRYTSDLTKCADITVCKIDDKSTITIKQKDFNSEIHTTDMTKCEKVNPPVVTPPTTPAQPVVELPRTGVADIIGGGIGIGSLVGAALAYRASRRDLM